MVETLVMKLAQIASFYVCRGKSEKEDFAKHESQMLNMLDKTRRELAKTRTLLTKAMTEADEVDTELRAEAATQSGVFALLATFRTVDNRSCLLVPMDAFMVAMGEILIMSCHADHAMPCGCKETHTYYLE